MKDHKVIIFYKYCKIGEENLKIIQARELAVCQVLNITGRIILAKEGINGTLEGSSVDLEIYKKHILKDKHFKKMWIKESPGTGESFPKIKVKIKDEIVSTKLPKHIDPTVKTGRHLDAVELHKWYKQDKDFVVIDMRNDFEIASGHFKNTVNINTKMQASRDLPEILKSELLPYKDKKVLTVCTAGVRCEKMSAYLMDQGFLDVQQLHGGIHNYMQKYPGENWKGALYTFDNRMTMDFGERDTEDGKMIGQCFGCKTNTEEYAHCSYQMCHKHLLICLDCQKENIFCKQECQNIFEESLAK
jgi:UPF0176 protein